MPVNILVKVSQPGAWPQVEFSGSSEDVISDQEIQTFGLSDDRLKDGVEKSFGARPGSLYLKSETPWGDLYRRYSWEQVHRVLQPRSATVLSVRQEPIAVSSQTLINNTKYPGKYSASINHQVEQTVSNTWSKGGELTIGQEIHYGIDIKAVSFGGSTNFSYGSSWGHDSTRAKTSTVGTSSSVEIDLPPGEQVVAKLQATRCFVELKVDYTATLRGIVACSYGNKYKDHHFWPLNIGPIQKAGGMPLSVESSEIIRVDYCTEAKVVVDPVNPSNPTA